MSAARQTAFDDDAAVLALHREIVACPSVTGTEATLCALLCKRLAELTGVEATRVGDSLYAVLGSAGPLLCFNTHLDTVPPSVAWSRDPHTVTHVEDETGRRVVGLGSNDAKASLAAMFTAFVRLAAHVEPGHALHNRLRLALLLGAAEETTGEGTRAALQALKDAGHTPSAALIGEPTELEPAIAQKGQLVVEVHATGEPCHAAHAKALGKANAVRRLVADLSAIEALPESTWGEPDPWLGETTCEPTLLHGGTASNVVPGHAQATLDLRTVPASPHETLLEALRQAVTHSDVRVVAELPAVATSREAPLVQAIIQARPEATPFGSRTMSDMVAFAGIDAVKVGPGQSIRSHQPDEFVYEHEIIAGATFYEAVAHKYAALASA